VKINAVAMKGRIEDELLDFVALTREQPLHIRFIEFMPFAGNAWDSRQVLSAGQMLSLISLQYPVEKLSDEPHATARKYRVPGHAGTFAFITTMSDHFCGDCNRLRLTAEGKMKNCLFGSEEVDLLGPLRQGEDLHHLIAASVQAKHAAMGGQFSLEGLAEPAGELVNRSMIAIGG
jgi:cyclic pyranopterin phosphate synthase